MHINSRHSVGLIIQYPLKDGFRVDYCIIFALVGLWLGGSLPAFISIILHSQRCRPSSACVWEAAFDDKDTSTLLQAFLQSVLTT